MLSSQTERSNNIGLYRGGEDAITESRVHVGTARSAHGVAVVYRKLFSGLCKSCYIMRFHFGYRVISSHANGLSALLCIRRDTKRMPL